MLTHQVLVAIFLISALQGAIRRMPIPLSIILGSLVRSTFSTKRGVENMYSLWHSSALEGFTESLTREVLPEWNIKATIVEPGGFRTGLGTTVVRLPTLEAYEQDHSPSQAMKRIRDPKAFIGDPGRAGQALFKIGGRRDLPMRVQLGTDSSRLVRLKAKRTMEDAMNPEWEELADSTNVDGVDTETVLQRIEAAWRKI